MFSSNSVDTVVNFLLSCAEDDIRLLRRTYETLQNPRWQQVQKLKVQVAFLETRTLVADIQDKAHVMAANAQVLAVDVQASWQAFKTQAFKAVAACRPYWTKALGGVAIALSWMAVGEEFAVKCWQGYVTWADEFVESRTEPEFNFAPVEIKLLTTPVHEVVAIEAQKVNVALPAEDADNFAASLLNGFADIKKRLFGGDRHV